MTNTTPNSNPTITWADPTKNTDGSNIDPTVATDKPTGYLVGVRDLAAAGSAVGVYPNTYSVVGGAATSATWAQTGFPALIAGHSYAVAAETEVGSPPGAVGTWSAEYQFQYVPVSIPNPPTVVSVS